MRNNRIAVSRGRVTSPPGNPIKDLFTSKMMKDGQIKLIKTGEQNTDEAINSFRESTDLHTILARFLNGDLEALNKFQPVYADLTNMPHSLPEALQVINNYRDAYNALPINVRRQFDNDYNKWLASAGSEEWQQIMEPFSSNSRANNNSNNNARENNNQAPAADLDPAP